jgi:hypothetical protein
VHDDDDTTPQPLELTALLAEVRRDHGVSASYGRLWSAIVAGKIPAVRDGNRWKVEPRHKPLVARVLGGRRGPVEPGMGLTAAA